MEIWDSLRWYGRCIDTLVDVTKMVYHVAMETYVNMLYKSKNYDFKKGSSDRSQQNVSKLELQMQILVKI